MTPDLKWLEILRASGWQTTFLATGCASFLALARWQVIPTESLPLIIPAMWASFLVCASLAAASIGQSTLKTFPVHIWLRQRHQKKQAQKAVQNYIPFMTAKDRKILGYLLHHRQKTFLCASDGGHASALISRGIISMGVRPGQITDLDEVPHEIPDYVWEVLEQHREEFPHTPDKNGSVEVSPWRVHWMAR